MDVIKRKVAVEELQYGMFVCELDRPWLETPFLFQGFLLETDEQLETLKRYCKYVYVDVMRSNASAAVPRCQDSAELSLSLGPDTAPLSRGPVELSRTWVSERNSRPHRAERRFVYSPLTRLNYPRLGTVTYSDVATVEEEVPAAREHTAGLERLVDEIHVQILAEPAFDVQRVHSAISEMVESIARNPDALLLLNRLKLKDAKAFRQSIYVATLLMAFGRHLGLPKEDLVVLGEGGLFFDIGKVKLPPRVLDTQRLLTPEELKVFKSHVAIGEQLLGGVRDFPSAALAMVSQHHERENGSGYPRGLVGNQISLFGKMAAIVDCYQSLCQGYMGSAPMAPHSALQMLHELAGSAFHPGLVEQFIHCIGIYPVGTLVELQTGEVAIVFAQQRGKSRQPRVLVVLDPHKVPYAKPFVLDLAEGPTTAAGEPYRIVKGLEDGMYGIDARQYF